MVAINRVRVGWSGFVGAPGVNTFYFTDVTTMQGPLNDLYSALVTLLPSMVRIQAERSGDIIEDSTGAITGTWTTDPTTEIAGTGAPAHAGPVGLQLQWLTRAIVQGRHLRGRTFIVPATTDAFDTDGSLLPSVSAAAVAAAGAFALATDVNLRVWSRPRLAAAGYTDRRGRVHPPVIARLGSSAFVVGGRVPDKAVVLRSRRD